MVFEPARVTPHPPAKLSKVNATLVLECDIWFHICHFQGPFGPVG